MKRLIEKTVFCGLVTAWRLATVPTRRSPEAVNATTDGVVRPPSAFSTTVGSPPSSTAMHELVVPRSIPMVLPMRRCSLCCGIKSESEPSRLFTGGEVSAVACEDVGDTSNDGARRGTSMQVTRLERNVNIAAVALPFLGVLVAGA